MGLVVGEDPQLDAQRFLAELTMIWAIRPSAEGRGVVVRIPEDAAIDPTVLGFTLGISLLAGALFGLFPALRHGRTDTVSALKEGGRSSSAGRRQHLARNALVVTQMALALVLLLLTHSGLWIIVVSGFFGMLDWASAPPTATAPSV